MADITLVKISALPAAEQIGAEDLLPVVQEGATKAVAYGVIKDDIANELAPDATLSEAGKAADAKAVGDALALKADKTELTDEVNRIDAALAAKANANDVNAALALKADTTDVNAALSLKADKTELTAGLATKQNVLTFDSTPTQGSTNPVTSGGLFNAIPAIDNTLTVAGDAADAKAAGDAINELKSAVDDLNNEAYDVVPTEVHENVLTLQPSAGIPSTRHIFDINIPQGRYFSFAINNSNINKYAFYYNGNLLFTQLLPNRKYIIESPTNINYLSVYISGGDITTQHDAEFRLELLEYNAGNGIDFLAKQIRSAYKGYIPVPYILLAGFWTGAGTTLNHTANQELHTGKIAVESGEELSLTYALPTSSQELWLAYIKWDNSGNVSSRIQIVSGRTGEYTGKFIVPNNTEYISFTFRTYADNPVFKIERAWSEFTDLESKTYLESNTVTTIAHRGDQILAPQNTAPAYILARKHGLNIGENDIALTQDGYFVMWHDTTLTILGNMVDISGYLMYTDGTDYYWVNPDDNSVYTWDGENYIPSAVSISSLTRCNGANYSVETLPFLILKRIDFGTYKGGAFTGTPILTFEEWVILCKELGMGIYVDKKFTYTRDQLLNCANIVKNLGMANKSSWLGLTPGQITIVRSVIPNARCGVLEHPNATNIETYASYNTDHNIFFDGNAKSGMTPEVVQLGLNAGYDVEVYYVDYGTATQNEILSVIKAAVDCGVTGITLDHYRVDEAFADLLNSY